MGEYDRLPYGKALLAVFLASVIQTVLFVLASALHLGIGLFLGWILGVFVGALLLRLTLGPFGWTISIKAAAITRLVCGFFSGLVVGLGAVAFTGSPDASEGVVTMGPAVLIVASILELLTSAGAITFFATRLEEPEVRAAWTPPASSTEPHSRSVGGAAVYSPEDFLADSARARTSAQ
jgi:hypothetical protein